MGKHTFVFWLQLKADFPAEFIEITPSANVDPHLNLISPLSFL